ncbi:MAG TPA: S8 family serine peptidase, partial [Solirubrobacteraceae bacterium]|nr:S8 family serine peptidase [Solirubrobacteraceae bacterium]
PDLRENAVSGTNCIDPSRSAQDDEGHGTHVAGTIGAANNGSGVVGVAPGTKLYAVKVLDKRGSGSTSSVVCGIDWVTKNAKALGIRVANMSLGGAGAPVESCATTTDPEHRAICTSSDPNGAGVVYVVAAGNSGWDFDYAPQPDIPAAYPQVITVSAMSDTDGRPGGSGSSCSREYDDRYASFSNFAATAGGAAHTIAGPGVCITSTRLGGGSTAMSGTSMASPHLAGAVALCISEGATAGACAGLASNDPGAYIAKLTGKATDLTYGFYGDPNQPLSGRFFGYLAWPGQLAPAEQDTTAPAAPTGLTATSGDARIALDWADNAEPDLARYEVLRSTTAGGPYAKVADVTGSSYTDGSLTNGTTYYYVVRAVDTSGNVSAASGEASATPVAAAASFTLSATGFKVKGFQYADLSWKTNSTATSVDVYRDGAKITSTANDGSYRDDIRNKGGGTYTYKVCAAGTETCSNEATVVF